jgi:hypothetical protein
LATVVEWTGCGVHRAEAYASALRLPQRRCEMALSTSLSVR